MTEECKVTKIKGGFAYIKLERSERCGGCKVCAFNNADSIEIPAICDVKCEKGDTVVVEMPQKQYVLAPLILFGIPLFLFLIGLIAGSALKAEILMVVFAFSFAAIGLIAASLVDKLIRTNRVYMPVIVDRIMFRERSFEAENEAAENEAESENG